MTRLAVYNGVSRPDSGQSRSEPAGRDRRTASNEDPLRTHEPRRFPSPYIISPYLAPQTDFFMGEIGIFFSGYFGVWGKIGCVN